MDLQSSKQIAGAAPIEATSMEGMTCGGLETRPNVSRHAVKPATLWNAIALFAKSHADRVEHSLTI